MSTNEQKCGNIGVLYLAPPFPGGLRGLQVDFVEFRWTPDTIYFAGSPAKLLCILHMEFSEPCELGGLHPIGYRDFVQ